MYFAATNKVCEQYYTWEAYTGCSCNSSTWDDAL